MKSNLTMLSIPIGLGLLTGVAWAYYELTYEVAFGYSKPAVNERPLVLEAPQTPTGRARILVEGSNVFDFGVMSKEETRHHTFVVRNTGDATLRLRFIDKSCQCTEVRLSRSEIPAGETVEIELAWKPNSYNLDFSQTARFETNDPGRIELDLTVRGRVQQILRLVPSSVSFNDVMKDTSRDVQVHVYGYRDEDLAVAAVEWLDPTSASHFEASVRPLSDEEIAEEAGALSGSAVTFRLKPGLPLGGFSQRARLVFANGELDPVEVSVVGSIVGNVTVIHPKYDASEGVLKLGTLVAGQSHETTAWLLLKGMEATTFDLQVVEVDPAKVLGASLGTPSRQGRTWRVPLNLQFIPDRRPVTRMGNQLGEAAKIVLESSSGASDRIVIQVTFALESVP